MTQDEKTNGLRRFLVDVLIKFEEHTIHADADLLKLRATLDHRLAKGHWPGQDFAQAAEDFIEFLYDAASQDREKIKEYFDTAAEMINAGEWPEKLESREQHEELHQAVLERMGAQPAEGVA